MQQRRNWNAAAGLLLGLGAVVGYFTLTASVLGPRFPVLRNVAILDLAAVAVALWLSWRGARRGGWPARIAATANLGLAGLFVFYLFGLSAMLPAAGGAPRVGQAAPDLSLANHRGEQVTLAALRGRPVVLVFYRGFW